MPIIHFQQSTVMSGSISPFVYKAYQLVSGQKSNTIVSWNTDGLSLIVWDIFQFEKEVLPQYFKHNNFSSFVRQLNTYGFHKVPNSDQKIREFSHPNFRRDCPEELQKVKRKGKSAQPQRVNAPLPPSYQAAPPRVGTISVPSLEETFSFTHGQPSSHVVAPSPQQVYPDYSSCVQQQPAQPPADPVAADALQYLLSLCKKQQATEERLASLCSEWRATKDRLDSLTNQSGQTGPRGADPNSMHSMTTLRESFPSFLPPC